jgi:hypothetical protein
LAPSKLTPKKETQEVIRVISILLLALLGNASALSASLADDARIEAFKNLKPNIDITNLPKLDPYMVSNNNCLIRGERHCENREITKFATHDYSVRYPDLLPNLVFFYSPDGVISALQINDASENYPYRSYTYSATDDLSDGRTAKSGELMLVGLTVSSGDTYLFKANGALDAHWVGDKCYLPDGTSCGSRQKTLQGRSVTTSEP